MNAKRLLEMISRRTNGANDEALLRRVLTSSGWRALAAVQAWRQKQRAARKYRLRLPALDQPPQGDLQCTAAATLLAHATSLRDRLKLLHDVFTAGGYETAAQLAEQLEKELAGAPRSIRRTALPLLTRVWVNAGDAPRAHQLWNAHGADLSRTQPLRQALLLDLGLPEAPRWRSTRGLHPYLADACIRRGSLDGEQLAAFLLRHPWTILANPEIELALHNASTLRGTSDLSAFNRYLERCGLPRIAARRPSTIWLAGLEFQRLPPAPGGPLVSVIMAARNAAHTVRYAVDSVLRQTHRRLELLIADDDSDDETRGVLRRHAAQDARVRLFRSVRNQGTYNVRNQLLEHARGELVTFQDADDVSLPNRLAMQVSAIERAGNVGAISEWLRIRPDGSVAFFANGRAARLSIVSLMLSRRVLCEIGPYPPARIGADLDIYRRVLKRYGSASVTRIDAPLALGLWSEQSLTRSASSQSLESGYRSPTRRRYSELVFQRDLFGLESLPDAQLLEALRAMGNFVEPSRLIALSADPA